MFTAVALPYPLIYPQMAQMAADGRQGVDSDRTGSIRTVLGYDPRYADPLLRRIYVTGSYDF